MAGVTPTCGEAVAQAVAAPKVAPAPQAVQPAAAAGEVGPPLAQLETAGSCSQAGAVVRLAALVGAGGVGAAGETKFARPKWQRLVLRSGRVIQHRQVQ